MDSGKLALKQFQCEHHDYLNYPTNYRGEQFIASKDSYVLDAMKKGSEVGNLFYVLLVAWCCRDKASH